MQQLAFWERLRACFQARNECVMCVVRKSINMTLLRVASLWSVLYFATLFNGASLEDRKYKGNTRVSFKDREFQCLCYSNPFSMHRFVIRISSK